MPSQDTKILKFNQYHKFDKAPFIIYADVECVIEKIDGSKNNPESSSTTHISQNFPWGFLVSAISSFRSMENEHDVYITKGCIKNVLWNLKRTRNEDN